MKNFIDGFRKIAKDIKDPYAEIMSDKVYQRIPRLTENPELIPKHPTSSGSKGGGGHGGGGG